MRSRWIPLVMFVALAVLPSTVGAQQSAPTGTATTAAVTASTPVNINTATAAQFEKLPGIGARTAARIVEYRQKNGPFKKPEELMNVRGVGEKSFLRIKALVTTAPAKGDVS